MTDIHSIELLTYINEYCPWISVKSYRVVNEGWMSKVAVINESKIFRFPVTRTGKSKILKEVELLRVLADYPFEIPHYEYFHKEEPVFGVYDYIDGISLKNCRGRGEQLLSDFSNLIRYQKSSTQNVVNLEHMDVYTAKQWKDNVERQLKNFEDELAPHLGRDLFQNLRNAVQVSMDTLDDDQISLTHGDLSKDNVLVSRNHRRLRGILDWADASVGDFALDLAAIVDDLENLRPEQIFNILLKVSPDVPIERVMMYRALSPLYYAFYISRTETIEVLNNVCKTITIPKLKRRYADLLHSL